MRRAMAAPRQRRIFAIVDRLDPEEVVRVLDPYLTERRKARIESMIAGRLASVRVAIEAPSDPHNAAAVVRTAEALGVGAVHLVAAEGRALEARKTTQGAHHWVEIHDHDDLEGFLAACRRAGVRPYGADMAAPRTLADLPVDAPLCIVVGNESRGLSDRARAAMETFSIPMVGLSQSLNLSVSAAIVLFDVTRRRRAVLGRAGDLSAGERARLRAYAYARSVDLRMLEGLFGREEASAAPRPTD